MATDFRIPLIAIVIATVRVEWTEPRADRGGT